MVDWWLSKQRIASEKEKKCPSSLRVSEIPWKWKSNSSFWFWLFCFMLIMLKLKVSKTFSTFVLSSSFNRFDLTSQSYGVGNCQRDDGSLSVLYSSLEATVKPTQDSLPSAQLSTERKHRDAEMFQLKAHLYGWELGRDPLLWLSLALTHLPFL